MTPAAFPSTTGIVRRAPRSRATPRIASIAGPGVSAAASATEEKSSQVGSAMLKRGRPLPVPLRARNLPVL